jgi:hypothetical protein
VPWAGASNGPLVDLNLATATYVGCTPATCLSIVRASNKTDLLPSSASGFAYNTFGPNVFAITPTLGLLIEETRTNQLINSTAPATQTTGTLAATAQTLWVNGSGSAALSNGTATGCTGAATNGSPVTFTPTAGTCTVTVTGSLNFEQLEQGSFGTSGIVTAGSAGTRAADQVSTAGPMEAIFSAAQGSIVLNTLASPNTANAYLVDANDFGSEFIIGISSPTVANAASGGHVFTATLGSGSYSTTLVKTGGSWDGTGRSLVANNGTLTTSAFTYANTTPNYIGSRDGLNTSQCDCYVSRATAWSTRIPDLQLGAATQ